MNPVGYGPALVDYDDAYILLLIGERREKNSREYRHLLPIVALRLRCAPILEGCQNIAGAPVPQVNVQVRASGVPTVIPAQREGISPALPENDGVYFSGGIVEAYYAITIVV